MSFIRIFIILLITTCAAYAQNDITEGKINSLLPGKWVMAKQYTRHTKYIKLVKLGSVSSSLTHSYVTIKSDGTITKTDIPKREYPTYSAWSVTEPPKSYKTNWEVKYPENILITESSVFSSHKAYKIISISYNEVVLQIVNIEYINYLEVYTIKDTVTDDKIINLLPGTWGLATSYPNNQGIIKLIRYNNGNSTVRCNDTVTIRANGAIEVKQGSYFINGPCLNGSIVKAKIYDGYWNMEYTGNIFTTSVPISYSGNVYKIISLTEDELLLMCY